MDGLVRKNLLFAMVASLLLGILLFGFENFAKVDTEANSKNLSCPYGFPGKTLHELKANS